jgi:hypothetical protein
MNLLDKLLLKLLQMYTEIQLGI